MRAAPRAPRAGLGRSVKVWMFIMSVRAWEIVECGGLEIVEVYICPPLGREGLDLGGEPYIVVIGRDCRENCMIAHGTLDPLPCSSVAHQLDIGILLQ